MSELMELVITETTVDDVGGVRVGLGNIWREEFIDAAGVKRDEVRGTLCLMFDDGREDVDYRVAAGDVVEIDGRQFAVGEIDEGTRLGSMKLIERVAD